MLSSLFIWNTRFFIHLISLQRHEDTNTTNRYMSHGYFALAENTLFYSTDLGMGYGLWFHTRPIHYFPTLLPAVFCE